MFQREIPVTKGQRAAAAPWIWLFGIGLATVIGACERDRSPRGSGGEGGDGGGDAGAGGWGGQVAQASTSAATTTTASGGGGAPPQGPCAESGVNDQCCETPWTLGKTCAIADPGCMNVTGFEHGLGTAPDASKTGCSSGYECSGRDDHSPTEWHCDIPGSFDPSEWAPACNQGQCPAGYYCAPHFGEVCLKSCKPPTCPPGTTLATYPQDGQNVQECVTACE